MDRQEAREGDMNKKELATILSEEAVLPFVKSAKYLDQVFEIIIEALEKGEKVKIHGFGNFSVRDKRARIGRNPKTREVVEIPARRVVTFKASPILRKKVNEWGP